MFLGLTADDWAMAGCLAMFLLALGALVVEALWLTLSMPKDSK